MTISVESNSNNVFEMNTIDYINENLPELKEGVDLNLLLMKIVATEDIEALNHYVNSGLYLNNRMTNNSTIAHFLETTSLPFFEALLQSGLNIHAVNSNGDTALLTLTDKDRNPELIIRLIELGLNPYNCNLRGRNCFDFLRIKRNNVNIQMYTNSIFLDRDASVERLLLEGEYELALDTIYFNINNLGGLKVVLQNINKNHYASLFSQLQNTLFALDRKEEAIALIKMFNSLDMRQGTYMRDFSINHIVAFLEGEYASLYNYLQDVHLNYYSTKTQSEFAIVQGYLFSVISGVEEDIVEQRKILKRTQLKKGLYPRFIKDLLFEDKEHNVETKEKNLNIMAETNIINKSSELKFAEALYYLYKKDFLTAEFKLRETIDFSIKNKFIFREYFLAKTLIQYIERNLPEA